MNKSESISNLAAALCKAQAELKNPSLDSTNPHFKSKFASLANIRNTITAIFSKHGLSVLQNLSSTEKSVGCSTLILHESGEWLESEPIYLPATKLDAQGFGSAATYARRYSLAAAAVVVGDDDDDGNEASKQANTPKTMSKREFVDHCTAISDAVDLGEEALKEAFGTAYKAAKALDDKDTMAQLQTKYEQAKAMLKPELAKAA